MEPGTEKQLAGAGRIIVEYSTSRARLAQLMAEVVSVADNFAKISKFIRSANAIAYAKLGDAEIDRIPTPDRFRDLTRAIAEEL